MYQDQDRTTPYGPAQTARVAHHIFKHGSPRLVILAVIAGLLGIVVGAASLTLFLTYKSTAETQIRQLQQAVSNAQAGNQSNVSSLKSVSGKISGIDATLNTLAGNVAPFNMTCSQYLTGPNGGPTTFYFACSDTKP
jgi:hypothetical protein